MINNNDAETPLPTLEQVLQGDPIAEAYFGAGVVRLVQSLTEEVGSVNDIKIYSNPFLRQGSIFILDGKVDTDHS